MSRIAVLGGGAWGTALAALYARAGHASTLYLRGREAAQAIEAERENRRYLPGIALPPALRATADLRAATAEADAILLVVPAQSLAAFAAELRGIVSRETPLVLCSKGIEQGTGRFASQVLRNEIAAARLAVLSGPSFAADVAQGLPTAVTVAADTDGEAIALARMLSTDSFRCYASSDIAGVEAGGALKNVLAIAAGAVAGRGLGASAGAAIITRGFVELRRLGEAFGAEGDTLMGLSGLGDLVLTCSSAQSRNFAYGLALGRGEDLRGLKLAEGVHSAGIAATLAERRGIDAPIIRTVAAVLAGDLSIDAAVRDLLARPLKLEAG